MDPDTDDLNNIATTLLAHCHQLPESYRRQKKEQFQQIVADAQPEGLQESRSPEATKENRRKLELCFDSMVAGVERQREKALDEFDTMNREQQNEAVLFWKGFASFFTKLMTWIKNKFDEFIQKLNQGLPWVYNEMKNVFGKVNDFFRTIFS